jgi:hypothetical protein
MWPWLHDIDALPVFTIFPHLVPPKTYRIFRVNLSLINYRLAQLTNEVVHDFFLK